MALKKFALKQIAKPSNTDTAIPEDHWSPKKKKIRGPSCTEVAAEMFVPLRKSEHVPASQQHSWHKWTNPAVDKVCHYHFSFHQMGSVAAEFHSTDPPVRKWRNSRPKYEWFMFYHGWKNRSHQSKNLWNLHLFSDDSPNLFIYSVPCIRPGHLMGSTHCYVSLLLKWPLPNTSSCPAQCIVHLDNHRAASPVRA